MHRKINFLQETLDAIANAGKTPSDVLWVGDSKYYTTWEQFTSVASIKYENGFGGIEIYDNLLIVGKDWWLERHEYDGSEWWEFKTLPTKPTTQRELLTPLHSWFEDTSPWKEA